jgi:hypothetical protein
MTIGIVTKKNINTSKLKSEKFNKNLHSLGFEEA